MKEVKQTGIGVPDRIKELLGEPVEVIEPVKVEVINKQKEFIPPAIKEFIKDNPVPGAKNVERDIDTKCPDRDLVIKRIYECNKDMFDLKTKYIQFGGHLIDLKPYCKYIWSWKKGRNCKNIYEVAEHCFNLKTTTTKNIIGITERFGYLMSSLKPEYEEYNYTQLTVMLPLSDEQLKLVNPGMTVQEISALKKVVKKAGQLIDQNCNSLINKGFEHFLTLKNDADRRDFLKTYLGWGVWLELKELGLKFYKSELNNGDWLVATTYEHYVSPEDTSYRFVKDSPPAVAYRLVKKGTSSTNYWYSRWENSESELLNYFKTSKAKICINFECNDFKEYLSKIEEIKGDNKNV